MVVFKNYNLKIIFKKICKKIFFITLFYSVRNYISYDNFSFIICEDMKLETTNNFVFYSFGFGFILGVIIYKYFKYKSNSSSSSISSIENSLQISSWRSSIPVIHEPTFSNQEILNSIKVENLQSNIILSKNYYYLDKIKNKDCKILHTNIDLATIRFKSHFFNKPLKYEQLEIYNNIFINNMNSQIYFKDSLLFFKKKYFKSILSKDELINLPIFNSNFIQNLICNSYFIDRPIKDILRLFLYAFHMDIINLLYKFKSIHYTTDKIIAFPNHLDNSNYTLYYYLPDGFSYKLLNRPCNFYSFTDLIKPLFVLDLFNSLIIIKHKLINEVFQYISNYELTQRFMVFDLSSFLTHVISVHLDFVIELIDINVGNLSILFQILDACYSFISNFFNSDKVSVDFFIKIDKHIFRDYLKKCLSNEIVVEKPQFSIFKNLIK